MLLLLQLLLLLLPLSLLEDWDTQRVNSNVRHFFLTPRKQSFRINPSLPPFQPDGLNKSTLAPRGCGCPCQCHRAEGTSLHLGCSDLQEVGFQSFPVKPLSSAPSPTFALVKFAGVIQELGDKAHCQGAARGSAGRGGTSALAEL